MDMTLIITMQAVVTALCWLVVAGAATLAVFSRAINDTLLERIGLSCVAITAASAAWRIGAAGWVSNGGMSVALAMAVYVVVVFIKHVRRYEP